MTADLAEITPSRRTPRRMLQLRLPFLMVLVAGSALIIWAWKFRDENRDMRRSFMSIQIHDLAHGKARERRFAAESLGDTSPDELGLVLPALAAGSRDVDADVRRASIDSLKKVIPRAAESRNGAVSEEIALVTPVLLVALKDKDPKVRSEAAQAVAWIQGQVNSPTSPKPVPYGPDPRRVLPALVEAMKDRDAVVRAEAILAFCRLAPATEDVPAELAAAIAGEIPDDYHTHISLCLDRPWRNADVLWVPLLKRLASRPDRGWTQAFNGISRLGRPPAYAVPAL